jgi:Tol biopolymer transport system component
LGIQVSVFFVENSYSDPPSPPSFKIIAVKNLTDDVKAESSLENFSDPFDSNARYNVGSIQKMQDGKELLILKEKKVFEGYNLSRASSSSDGMIAVSSYSGLRHQIDGDGSDPIIDPKTGNLAAAISSVWIIDPSGAKHKITPDTMHAVYPVLSRDGHWLAFSGQTWDEKGGSGDIQIYVVSLKNGVASAPVSLNLPSKGEIIPVKWDNEQLVVLTTEEENSSTYQLTWIHIMPGQQRR